jgi:hypothetical protein
MRKLKIHIVVLWSAGAHSKCGRRVPSENTTAYAEQSDCRACGGTKGLKKRARK